MAGHSHWAGIKHKKGKADKKRSNMFSKLSREIIVAAKLGDKEWAKKVYKNAEENAEASSDFIDLADSIIENLSDKDWAKKVFKPTKKRKTDLESSPKVGTMKVPFIFL